MEISTNPDITDDMLHLMDGMIMRAVYDDLKGFDVVKLTKQIRHGVLKIMDEFIRTYQDQGRVRGMQLKKITERLGKDGITLPGTKIIEKLGKPFTPGQMIVLTGEKKDTAVALDIIASHHMMEDDGTVVRCIPQGSENSWGSIIIPEENWKNAAHSLASLNKALEPVIRKDCLLLLVDDLNTLYCEDPKITVPEARQSFAIKRLYQWCVENIVAVVIADNEAGSNSRDYSLIKSFPVDYHETVGGLMIDGEHVTFPDPYEGN
jgi:hypothetical protein